MDVFGLEAGAVGFDEEAADTIVFVFELGPDDGDVGDAAVGDPHFFAVEDVAAGSFAGACAHAAGVGAEVGFSKAEAADFFAGGEGGQPLVLLLFCAEGVDGIHDERGLDAGEAAQTGVAAFELLHDEAILDVGHAGAAVAVEVDAEEAELAHGFDELAREAAVAVALLDDGDEVVFDEVAGGFANHALVFSEEGVEVEEINAFERKRHAGSCSVLPECRTP